MKRETQTIEFKQSWHDEYLKWIYGFANAQGGKLVIGVDDAENAVGVGNGKDEPKSWPKSWPQSWPQSTENKVLSLLFFGDMSRKQLSDKLGIVLKANSLREVIDRLMRSDFVEYTIPNKPNSRLQKYHLTDEGFNHILRQNAEVRR